MKRTCRCGYTFSLNAPAAQREFESYALVRDKDYGKFLESERKARQSGCESERLRAIARSSRHVGSVLECPKCSRLLLVKPNARGATKVATFYLKDDHTLD